MSGLIPSFLLLNLSDMIANKLYIHPDEVDIIESKACWCVEVSNKPINKGLLTYINAATYLGTREMSLTLLVGG